MNSEPSLWSFIINAGPVVKAVLCILFLASVLSWAIIIQRVLVFKKSFEAMERFSRLFWSNGDLSKTYQQIAPQAPTTGLGAVFCAGFKEFRRLTDTPRPINTEAVMESVRRAMRVVHSREITQLEQHLPFLATVGSISPYVGLFGTVWGIMTSFRSLGSVQQASIAMVAPGISEALIATAVGLFAAIPAVIAYNRLANHLDRCIQQSEIFQDELIGILQYILVTKEPHATAKV
jgi:biopolymer transport protein TolQ